jgi:hypothetical protein
MTRILAASVMMAFAVAAAAGEAADAPKPAAPAASLARLHPVVGRLGLGDEPLKKIDEILGEHRQKLLAAAKEMQAEGKALDLAKWQDQQKQLQAEANKKVREAVPAELQAKFDAGVKVMEEFAPRQAKLQEQVVAALKDAAGDKEKIQAAQKDIVEKARALAQELNKELDEKVGKMPQPPKAEK